MRKTAEKILPYQYWLRNYESLLICKQIYFYDEGTRDCFSTSQSSCTKCFLSNTLALHNNDQNSQFVPLVRIHNAKQHKYDCHV